MNVKICSKAWSAILAASFKIVNSSSVLINVIESLRLIKTEEELTILKEAAKIADQAFEHILTFIKPGVKEIDVANELEFTMRQAGATSSSFDIIVASG